MEIRRDRNLLFGVLAVQVRGVTPVQLVEVAAGWATDPSVSVSQRMVDKGILKEEDRILLEKLVDDAIRAHGGDAATALDMLAREQSLPTPRPSAGEPLDLDDIDTSPMEGVTFFAGSGQEITGVHESPGRYTLISHHAKGGMGRVLIVHDEYLGRNIALKELLPAADTPGEDVSKPSPVRQSTALVARFLQEARITSQLEHPAIVPVYELGRRQDGSLYYTMRLVRGKTFAAALKERQGLDDRLCLLSSFIGLCQAIAYAHSRNVIHRDIKPANVMLGAFGETVVLDWGLAKVRDTDDIHMEEIRDTLHFLDLDEKHSMPQTAYGRALGTPHYMPVEQAEGRIDKIDEKSDVYSLGAVLYEILTGTTPYQGASTREILMKVINDLPTPVRAATPDAPPELAAICEKALQKDPARRYQSAAELADEVQRFIDGSLVKAYRYSLGQIVAQYYARHKAVVNLVLAFAAALLMVGAFSYINILHARDREHLQRVAAEDAKHQESIARQAAENSNYRSQIRLAQAHLDQYDFRSARELLWKTAETKRGWEWGYLLNQATPEAYTVEMKNANIYGARFSPDGKTLAVNSYPAVPALYDAQTGEKRISLEGEPNTNHQMVFSNDGALCAGIGGNGLIAVWNTTTGKRVHAFKEHFTAYEGVFDGMGVRLCAGFSDGQVRIYDLKTGATSGVLAAGDNAVNFMRLRPGKEQLLTGTGEGPCRLWDLNSKTLLFNVSGISPVFSPNGERLATTEDGAVMIWDGNSGAALGRFEGDSGDFFKMKFSADGNRLLAGGAGVIRLWDVMKRELVWTFRTPMKANIHAVFFLCQDAYALHCGVDGSCSLMDTATGACVRSFHTQGALLSEADVQPGGGLGVFTACEDRLFQAINLLAPGGETMRVSLSGIFDDSVNNLSASASGDLLLAPMNGNTHLMNPLNRKSLGVFNEVYTGKSTVSADGSAVAMLIDRYTPTVFSHPAENLTWTPFTGQEAMVSAIALSAEGAQGASGDMEGGICLWPSATGKLTRRWRGHEGEVTALHFSPDGRRLLSTGLDGGVTVWSVETGDKMLSLSGGESGVGAGTYNASGEIISVVRSDGAVQWWDAVGGALLGSFTTDSFVVQEQEQINADASMGFTIAFWPDGKLLLVKTRGAAPRLWDMATGDPVLFLQYGTFLTPLAAGQSLAIADNGGSVSTMNIPGVGPKGLMRSLDRTDYEAGKRAGWNRNALVAPSAEEKTNLFISSDDFARILPGLLAENDTNTPAVLQNACPALGLQRGDEIIEVKGAPVQHRDNAVAALNQLALTASGGPDSPAVLTIRRGGDRKIMQYWRQQLQRDEEEIALTRAEALSLVQLETDHLTFKMQMHRNRLEQYWLPVAIPYSMAVADKAGLAGNDKLFSIDGAATDTAENTRTGLASLYERLKQGDAVQFVQTFRRGWYREVVRRYTVTVK